MMSKSFQLRVSVVTAVIFLAGSVPGFAKSMDMKEVKAKFKEEKGIDWKDADSELRRDFMYEMRGKEKKEEREKRVEGVKVPFHIREGFRKEYRRNWDDATEEEQELFIEDYEKLKRKWEAEERERAKEKEKRLREKEQEKRKKEQEFKKKQREKAKKEKEKAKELREKKKKAKKRLKDAKERKSKFHEKLKDMREQRNREIVR